MISVIVPVYNAGVYLKICVESVLRQSFENWELILVDDGSTDGSGYLCDLYAASDPRISVVHQWKRGVSLARQAGLDRAGGDWIAFVDADDWLSRRYLETLVDAAEAYMADAAVCDFRLESGEDGPPPRLSAGGFQLLEGREGLCAMLYARLFSSAVWGKLFRRGVWGKTKFPPQVVYGEDLAVLYPVLGRSRRVVYLPEKLYCYRVHEGSMIRNRTNLRRADVLTIAREIYADRQGRDAAVMKAARSRLVATAFHLFLSLDPPPGQYWDWVDIRDCCREEICRHRRAVFWDDRSREKTRLAALASYGGMTAVEKCFSIVSR